MVSPVHSVGAAQTACSVTRQVHLQNLSLIDGFSSVVDEGASIVLEENYIMRISQKLSTGSLGTSGKFFISLYAQSMSRSISEIIKLISYWFNRFLNYKSLSIVHV